MKILALQHTAATPLGTVGAWTQSRGHELTHLCLWRDKVPATLDFDALVLCGGEMGVHDAALHPWLLEECRLIERTLAAAKPVVGLCLGGQLLAHVLGARVFRHRDWEVGWHPVRTTLEADQAWGTSGELWAFHYHQDVFELPAGSRVLAGNDWWSNQAFAYGTNVLAFQFHPETSPTWVRACADDPELPISGRTQSAAAMKSDGEKHQPALQRMFYQSLDSLLAMSRNESP